MSVPQPSRPQLDDAQRAILATAAAGMAVAPNTILPADVDTDDVLAKQLTRADLRSLNDAGKHDEVERARREGRLLLLSHLPEAFDNAPAAPPAPDQLTRDDLERMASAGDHAGIEKARREGKLEHLLGNTG